MDDPSLVKIVIGVVTGVVVFLLGQVLWRWITDSWKRFSLKTALMTDAIITLNKLRDQRKRLDTYIANCTKADILKNPSGIVLAGPLEKTSDAYELLSPWDVQKIVHYFDRWERFQKLEERYEAVFQKVIEELKDDPQPPKDVALIEYLDQAQGMLRLMKEAASELCYLSCVLFKDLCSPPWTYLYIRYSRNRWSSMMELVKEMQQYEGEVSSATRAVEEMPQKPTSPVQAAAPQVS
jgi:hypothetical protein